ncbi:MAG: MBL fold metallo-hydrolase [Acidimicrobiales bacterium]|nr:MBL fold metallo-hydrolase [Acidimicrobiales bacterium]
MAVAEPDPASPKQEKEEASTEVVEVVPGILRLQLPIDFTGLGHVNCYALVDGRGVALVDPGLPGEGTWQALGARLAAAEIPLERVHTVVVTHSHPDHYGSAGLLAERTGADVVAFERFRTRWDETDLDDDELTPAGTPADGPQPGPTPGSPSGPSPEELEAEVIDVERMLNQPSPWGGTPFGPPPERLEMIREHAAEFLRWMRPPSPTIRIADGGRITLGGRDWVGLFTPGHTDDHLCLHSEDGGILLAGDQVLPTITPHVSGFLTDDSLNRYVESLDRLTGLPGVELVLPAHGHPFGDLGRRVAEIKRHHDERLDELLRIGAEVGEASVVDLSQRLFAPRSWGAMAEDETFAHLEHLRLAGRAERREEAGILYYRL